MTGSVPLVLLAAVAVVNPPRLSPALRVLPPVLSESTSIRRDRAVTVTALGAFGAGVALTALATGAGRLLEAIDVSAPTLRVAAGLVLVLAVVRDLVSGRPKAEPALAGWGASLVPVAVPFVARPELAILVVSIASVEGVGVAVVALVLVAATTTLCSSVGDAGPLARVLDWSTGLLMAACVAAGVALTVDGIYGV